jgi:hypothetical protein
MNIDHDMIQRAIKEMDRRLMAGEWESACEIARFNIAYAILDAAMNGTDAIK